MRQRALLSFPLPATKARAVVLLFGAVTLVAEMAFGDEPQPASSPGRGSDSQQHEGRVLVAIADKKNESRNLILDIEALLTQQGFSPSVGVSSELNIDTVLQPPKPPFSQARVLIDTTNEQTVLLIIADDARGRMIIRRIERNGDDADVVAEKLLQIIHSSLGAIAAGGEFGQNREAALAELRALEETKDEPTPKNEPSKDLSATGSLDASVTVAYGLVLLGDSAVSHGPRLGSVLTLSGRPPRVSLFATVGYLFGTHLANDSLSGRIDAVPLRLGVGAELPVGSLIFSPRLSGGVDVVLPHLDITDDLVSSSEVHLDPAIGLALRNEFELSHDVGVFLDLGADVYPRVSRYLVFDELGQETIVFAPSRVRPNLHVGLRFF